MSTPHDTAPGHHPSEAATSPQRCLTPAQHKIREIRSKAIESLLAEKGLVTPDRLDAVLNAYENDIGPLNGSRVVARAWVDPAYKERLLKNGTAAIAELGFGGLQGEHLVVVEDTLSVHNVIVCVLCSCYPWPVLGLPPFWYKSLDYRSRVAGNPRAVLRQFGLELDESVEILVWNSSANTRYMVLPERPSGTENLSETELATLVTRDAMIGVARVQLDKRPPSTLSQRHVADMEGTATLPRQSGELLFQDPWEGCVFALAVALCEHGLYAWGEFQKQLIAAIAASEQPEVPAESKPTYYECWLTALEALLLEKGILTKAKIDSRAGWLARAASSGHSRSFMHWRWNVPDDEDDA